MKAWPPLNQQSRACGWFSSGGKSMFDCEESRHQANERARRKVHKQYFMVSSKWGVRDRKPEQPGLSVAVVSGGGGGNLDRRR